MIPFERDVYIDMLKTYLEKIEKQREQNGWRRSKRVFGK